MKNPGVHAIGSMRQIAESAGERISKIGQYLAKLWARVECPVF